MANCERDLFACALDAVSTQNNPSESSQSKINTYASKTVKPNLKYFSNEYDDEEDDDGDDLAIVDSDYDGVPRLTGSLSSNSRDGSVRIPKESSIFLFNKLKQLATPIAQRPQSTVSLNVTNSNITSSYSYQELENKPASNKYLRTINGKRPATSATSISIDRGFAVPPIAKDSKFINSVVISTSRLLENANASTNYASSKSKNNSKAIIGSSSSSDNHQLRRATSEPLTNNTGLIPGSRQSSVPTKFAQNIQAHPIQNVAMSTSNTSNSINKVNRNRLEMEINQLLQRKSSHAGEAEDEWFDQYSKRMDKLARQEAIVKKESEIDSVMIKAFSCKECSLFTELRRPMCVEARHDIRIMSVKKRFFECCRCRRKGHTIGKADLMVPDYKCACGSADWRRCGQRSFQPVEPLTTPLVLAASDWSSRRDLNVSKAAASELS